MKNLRLILLFLFVAPLPLSAAGVLEFEADSGTIYSVHSYPAAGRTLFLWLPSEYGLGVGYQTVAPDLARLGIDVWVLDIHSSLMVPAGRSSLENISREDMQFLIRKASDQGFDRIFLASGSRGAMLALQTAYDWQLESENSNLIRGLVMFSPHPFEGRVLPGYKPSMSLLSGYSNLPIYLVQPEYSTKYAHTREIMDRLHSGGSPVYLDFQQGVQDGFQSRPVEDLTRVDLDARARLPDRLKSAMELLHSTRAAPLQHDLNDMVAARNNSDQEFVRWELNRPHQKLASPALNLRDFNDVLVNLKNLRGQVVVVNFWATWCEPCVREMPSLDRLLQQLSDRPFRVLAVNINESRQAVAGFLEKIPVGFDILMDPDGKTVRDWNVYAYPSTFVIGKSGNIEYVYRGALEWDDEDIIQHLKTLF